jgi:hypothetical protein
MRYATALILMLAIAGCAHQRVRSAGERAHDPFIWAGESGDPGSDTVGGIIAAAATAATAPADPPVPFCTPADVDPPHTCPAKTAEEPTRADDPR